MPILKYFQDAAKELGLDYGDANGPQKEGVTLHKTFDLVIFMLNFIIKGMSPLDWTRWKGRGLTTCSVFIDPIVGIRKSLTVVKYAEVTRIIFTLKTATGVEFTKFGKTFLLLAKREVIISAGAFGSPILLFKSGIGPAEMLSRAKVRFFLILSPLETQTGPVD